MARLPGSVLFACDHNAVRSPIAEGLMKLRFGDRVYADSVGVRCADIDPFAVAVMDEIGVDLSAHKAKTFGDLTDTSFDYIVSLSPAAQHSAVELTRTMSCELMFWHTLDATAVRGNRDAILQAYRDVRDAISAKIDSWLGPEGWTKARGGPETP
ncbi:MAG: low molecular weight phosphatase family protein [Proteobacteria bacterium]|nr:low molecular weight phosphatase family protein [Pseudomonadota bacterium]